jgi:hypothetical protein
LVRSESPAGVLRLQFLHNTPETDLPLRLGRGLSTSFPDWSVDLDLYEVLDTALPSPAPGAGILYQASLPLPLDQASFLPPALSSPFWLRGEEGGDPAHSALLVDFRIETTEETFVTDSTVPAPVAEGSAGTLWIPEPAIAFVPADPAPAPRVFPNPFARAATVVVHLPSAGPVILRIHDPQGRRVRTLHAGDESAGRREYAFDGTDDRGRRLPAGAYYLVLEQPGSRSVTRLVRLP